MLKCYKNKLLDPTQPEQATTSGRHFKSPINIIIFFAGYMTIFHLIIWMFTPENDPFRIFITNIVVRLVNECGINAVAYCTEIILPKAHWVVAPECTAINVHILFVSFILAYAAPIWMKLLAIAIGLPFIFLANIGRLVSLAWITEKHPQYASWFHNYVWQGAFLLMIVLMWMVWIELMVQREEKICR